MTGGVPEASERARLASFVHARHAELIASIVAAAESQQPVPQGAEAFVTGFLARLCLELRDGDPAPVDRLTKTAIVRDGAHAFGRIAAIACAVVSQAYADAYPGTPDVTSYLALRSSQLELRFKNERTTDRVVAARPSPYGEASEVVRSLLSALEAHDRFTCDHSRAVGVWSGRLAKTMGLSAEEQAFAVLAGTVHDVGKIATPTELLLKPAALTAQEWEVMHSHAQIGAKMLERVPSLAAFAPIVRAHHERFDGLGYPDRLSGCAIPLVSRVLAVSDSFHAMISKRPYRAPISVPGAARELRRCAGTQWDPAVVAAMLSIVEPAAGTQSVASGNAT